MKRFLLAVTVAGVCFGASAQRVVVKKTAPACLTEEQLSEFTGAINRKDYKTGDAILAEGNCIVLSRDMPGNTLDSSLKGWTKVRFMLEGDLSVVMYTINEAIRRD